MYHYGTGVKKSNKEAFKWMRIVADDLFEEAEYEYDDEYLDEEPEEESDEKDDE
jgi:TPR repeat protein